MGNRDHSTLRLLIAFVALILLAGCAPLERMRGNTLPPEIAVGRELLRNNNLERAKEQFERAIRKDPTDPLPYILIASEVCRPLHHWDLTIAYAERGLAATPKASPRDRAILYNILGEAYLQIGDYTKALAANRAAFKLLPDDPTVMNNLGYNLAEMPDNKAYLNEALDLTTRAVAKIREQPHSEKTMGIFMDSLGWVQFKMQKYDLAISTLSQAAELAPDQPEIHYHLARAYEARGKLDEANTCLQKAYRVAPQNPQLRSVLDEMRNRLSMKKPSDTGGADREQTP